MKNINWENVEKNVHKEADEVREKLKKGLLISQKEAALIRESDIYKASEQTRRAEDRRQQDRKKAVQQEEIKKVESEIKKIKDIAETPEIVQQDKVEVVGPEKPSPDLGKKEIVKTAEQPKPAEEPEPVFDINNKEQQIELIKKAGVYYAEKEGREGNLEKAFSSFEKDNKGLLESYRGKDILLKINLVDPHHSQSCTDVKTVKKVIELIKKYGPKKIFVGDMPSRMGKLDKGWNELEKMYRENLGYIFSDKNVELLNLENLESEFIQDGNERFEIKKVDRFGGIINISRPKMHGQFGYTGCVKNLMGLMTQASREEMIHGSHEKSENNKILSKFSTAFLKHHPDIISISDGFDFVVGHEHIGIPRETNFAMVTRDPFNADNKALEILGLNKDRVAYIFNKDFPIRKESLRGQLSKNRIHPSELESKHFLYEGGKEGGGVSVVEVINDPAFINKIETKKRYVFSLLDSIFVIAKRDSVAPPDLKKYLFKRTFREVLNDTFPSQELKDKCPYKDIPEFKKLAIEWFASKGIK